MAIKTVQTQRMGGLDDDLTKQQLELLFEEIASCALTMADLAGKAQLSAGPTESNTFRTLEVMAQRVGVLADRAIGFDVNGDLLTWTLGHHFRDSGAATDRAAA